MGLLAQRLAATSASQGPTSLGPAPIPDYTSGVNTDTRTGTGLLGFVGNIGADMRDIALGLGRLGALAAGDVRDIATLNLGDVDVLTPAFVPEMVGAFAEDLADRYGEPTEIPSEFYDHPLSFVADALTIAGGAGAGARAATGVGRWGDIAARTGIASLSREAQMARAASVQGLRATRAAAAESALPRTMTLADDAGRLQTAKAGLLDMAQARQAPLPPEGWQGPLLADGTFASVSKMAEAAQANVALVKAAPTPLRVLDRLLPAGERWIPRHQTIFGKKREGFDWIETRTAEANSGYTRGLWGSRNPLVQAVWTNPIQRRILTQSRGRFAAELADLRLRAAMGEKVNPYEIDKRMAALANMEAAGAERVSRYEIYGHALVKTDIDRWIGRLMTEGIIQRRTQAEQMAAIMEGVEGADTFHRVIQSLAGDRQLANIPDDILGPSLERMGYTGVDAFERAARDVLYDTEAGQAFTIDQKATLIDKVLRGDVRMEMVGQLLEKADTVPAVAPERARFREELRGVGDQVGMPETQQDFYVGLLDGMARSLSQESPDRFPTLDSVYAAMRIEFQQKWVEGIENSLQQRVKRLYRGAVKYVDGKPQVDSARLARWFWKGVDENPELLEWYQKGSNLAAELTRGMTTTFRNADGEILETVDDYELFIDLLSAHSLGTNIVKNFQEAWEVYTRFKTGRIHLQYSDFEGWTPESKQLQNIKTVTVRAKPLLDWVARQGMPWDKNSNEARYFYRAMERGSLSVDQADKLANALGVHPYRIWGDEFYEDITVRGATKIRAFDPDGNEIRGLFTGGKTAQAKARLVKEILEGHLIRHWEQEIAEGKVRDIPIEEAMKRFEHRTRALGLSSRQKARAYAASLKLDGDRAAVDRRMGLLFGIFTGAQQWKQAIGTYPDGTPIPPKFARKSLTGSDYGQVERWLREVQHHINRHLPAGSAPYALSQVQAVLWGQAVAFAAAEANRVARLIRRGIDTDGSPLTDQSLAALEEYHRLLRAAVTTEGQNIEDYADAWLKLRDGPMGETLVQQMRSRYGQSNVQLAQRVTDIVKGQIIFGDDFPATIQMFADGDFTTLTHEGAHLLRRLVPDAVGRELWLSYKELVHGDGPIPDDGGVPLKQTVRSMEPIGAFAAVDAPGGEIAEGQFVNLGGDTVRVVRLYQKGDRYYAEIQNHATGAVKKDVALGDMEIVPELDPYRYGLTGPLGVPPVAKGKVGVVKGGVRGGPAEGTGEGARYATYVGTEGTLTAEGAARPYFAYTAEGKAARAAWDAAHKDDVQEIRAAVKVDTTGGTPRYEIVPIAMTQDGKWVEARTLVGDPVPQERPAPTDITPEPVYKAVTPVTDNIPELAKKHGADPIAQDFLARLTGDILEKWSEEGAAKGQKLRFATVGESPGYFLFHSTIGVEGDKGLFYAVSKALWDDPNQKVLPDEHMLRDAMNQSASKKRHQAPDAPRWAKPGAASLKKKPQRPTVRPKTTPKPEDVAPVAEAPIEPRGGGLAALEQDIRRPQADEIESVIAEAEVPTEILDEAQEAFFARSTPTPGDENPIGVDEIDLPEGWYVSELIPTPGSENIRGGPYYDIHVDPDLPEGTKVVFAGEWYDQAEYAVVEMIDPNDVLLGNQILPSKMRSLENDMGRGMPVAMRYGDMLIAFEGNHRLYRARQQETGPIKVAVMRGQRVADELGPLEDLEGYGEAPGRVEKVTVPEDIEPEGGDYDTEDVGPLDAVPEKFKSPLREYEGSRVRATLEDGTVIEGDAMGAHGWGETPGSLQVWLDSANGEVEQVDVPLATSKIEKLGPRKYPAGGKVTVERFAAHKAWQKRVAKEQKAADKAARARRYSPSAPEVTLGTPATIESGGYYVVKNKSGKASMVRVYRIAKDGSEYEVENLTTGRDEQIFTRDQFVGVVDKERFEARLRAEALGEEPAAPRDVQAEQAARGGLDETAEAAAQDEFAARIAAEAEAAEKAAILREQGLEVDEAELREEILGAQAAAPGETGPPGLPPGGLPTAEDVSPGAAGPPAPPLGPPGAPPSGHMPWSVAMEEAFAEDMERWIYNQLLPTDERLHPGFRTLAESLRDLWRKVRGFALERQMVPEKSAEIFDRYFGKAIADASAPDPNWLAGRKRRTRILPNVTPIDHPAVGLQVAQMEGDAQVLHHAARQAYTPMRRKLATVFQRSEFDTRVKDPARAGQKLRDGIPVTDALQIRIRIDTWVGAREALAKIEAAGLRILGIEDTLGTPGMFGSRGLRAYVEDPDMPGFVSEIEIGTPTFDHFRRATWKHDQAARQIPIEIARVEQRLADLEVTMSNLQNHGDPETDAPAMRSLEKQQIEAVELHAALQENLQAAERIMEGLNEMVVDEIDAHHGGALPGGRERQVINQLRLWNAEHVEQDLIDIGYADFKYLFDRLWYPLRKTNGAEFIETDDHPEGEWIGGGDPYQLDAARAADGLPQPIYFPHMKPPPKLSDWMLQRGKNMFGARKLAENKNLKRWHGELMPEDPEFMDPGYLTDIEMAYKLRAARAIKMRDTQRLVNWITQNFGRKIADPQALSPGEQLYAPDFINALFRAVIKLDDQMGTLLANLPTDLLLGADFTRKEGAEAAFSVIEKGLRASGVQEIQAGALVRALDEVMPTVKREFLALTSQGVDYYAIPKVVARRLEASIKWGLPGNNAIRLFWDSPTNLWRAVVLYGRPAWLVNNFFGNLVFLKLQGGRFSDVVRQRFDPEFKDMLQQMAKELPGTEVGFFQSMSEQYTPMLGSAAEGTVGGAIQAAKVGARKNRVLKPAYSYGDFMKNLNQEIENYFRRAGMMRAVETEINPEHLRSMGRRFWADKKEMERVLVDGIPDEAVERVLERVNTFFGDFSQMSPVGRHIVRRFLFPFWGFYRHVVKLFLQLPSEYPGRFTVLRAIEQATQDMVAEYGPLPEWMGGMATWGGQPQSEGDTRFVSMAGPNPLNILTDDILSMLHPAIKMVSERATGRDAFTGRPFSSPDVVTPYGSDQQFQIVRDANGMPIDAQPVGKVIPPLGVHVLSQVPQYDLIKNLLAGGRTYDTEGILSSVTGGPVIDSGGQVVRPVGLPESVGKYLGFSTFPFDVPSYQERLGQERENALSYAMRQWQAEQGG